VKYSKCVFRKQQAANLHPALRAVLRNRFFDSSNT
jgi:hypothetical protein